MDYREYRELMAAARALVQARRSERFPGLRIAEIDADAIKATTGWPLERRLYRWDWRKITKRRTRERIDMAFWIGSRLCGVAYGEIKGDSAILMRVEGNPDPSHELKGHVIDLAIAMLETVANALDLPVTKLEEPDPALIERYAKSGYGLADGGDGRYLVKVR